MNTENKSTNPNRIHAATIIDYMSDAKPIVKLNGKVIILDDGVIGSEVEFTVNPDGKTGKVQKTIKESPFAENNYDKILKKCGFPFIDLNYEKECEIKQKKINDAMQRIAKISISVEKFIKAPNITGYRNNVQLQLKNGQAGFFEKGTNDLLTPDNLVFAEPEIERIYQNIKHTKFDKDINLIGIRSSGEETMIIAVSNGNIDESRLIDTFKNLGVNSIYHNVKYKSKRHYTENMRCIYGNETIKLKLSGKEFELLPNAFFQVNTEQAKKMYSDALELLELQKSDTLLDLYCGMSTMGIIAADKVGEVIAIDSNHQAILSAKKAASVNSVTNLTAICKKAEDATNIISRRKNVKLLLDPPRAGIDKKLIDAITLINPEKITYISCNPATLARDLGKLTEKGYNAISIIGYDLFPRTAHVETVALIQNVKS